MNLDALNKATQGKTRTTGISPFSEIETSRIYANPLQPRKSFENIEELADSIMTHGLIQPIVVVAKENGRYMIIGGERRFRAVLYAGIKTIKAHVLNVDDEKVQELTLIENIQRSDLSDFEIAVHIGALWDSGRYTSKTELAEAIGKSQTYLSKAFSVLKLDDAVVADIKDNNQNISLSVLDEIARVKEPAVQKEVYDKYVNKEIVRDDIKKFKKEKTVIKKETKELVFDYQGANFEKIKDDLANGIIFHPISHIFHLKGLKTYKMYKITIEEI